MIFNFKTIKENSAPASAVENTSWLQGFYSSQVESSTLLFVCPESQIKFYYPKASEMD